MKKEDKKILIKEIKNYKGNTSLIYIYFSLGYEKLRKKVLIQNKTGMIGTLLDKYKDNLDYEIIKEICDRDLVNGNYYDIEEFIEEISKLNITKDIELFKKEFYKDKVVLWYEVIENNVQISYYKDYLDNVKNDKKFMLAAVKKDWHALEYASEELRNDKKIVLEAIKQDGDALHFASQKLRNDKKIVLEAIKYEFSLIEYANEELKNDKKFVLKAIKYGNVLEWASKELRKDKEIMLEAIRNNSSYFEYASKALKNDKEVVMEAVKRNARMLALASEKLRNDRDVILEAIKNDDRIVTVISEKLKNKEFYLEAAKRNGYILRNLNEKLKNDKEVVMEAVKNNSKVFKYASEELKNDIDFIISLATKNIVVGVSNKMYDKIYSIYGDKYKNVIIIDILYDLSIVRTTEITEEDLPF